MVAAFTASCRPGCLWSRSARQHPLPQDLREVHIIIDTGKKLRIISNDLTSPAEVIADLYKTRWQIELFFRWVKQNLKIRYSLVQPKMPFAFN